MEDGIDVGVGVMVPVKTKLTKLNEDLSGRMAAEHAAAYTKSVK